MFLSVFWQKNKCYKNINLLHIILIVVNTNKMTEKNFEVTVTATISKH